MSSRLILLFLLLLLAASALIFWLWLVNETENVATLCPKECQCDPGDNEVTCYGTSLTSVPLIRLPDVRELGLYNNNISIIERGCFVSRGLTGLEKLSIWNCGLKTIHLGAFSGLTNLTFMDINSNEISEIIPGTFVDVRNLEFLDLGNNGIQLLNNGVFRGLLNLIFINLSGNKLQYLHPDSFLGIPNFQFLILHSIPGLQVPTDRNFINSPSLSQLDISYCNVSSVSVETFANVSALEVLKLTDNILWTLDVNIFRALPKLSVLYLDGNPLHCDCRLKEVWRWCVDRNIQTAYWDMPKCETPSEINGMGWEVLGMLDNGQCLQDNIIYND
jgi:hypothetical protein